MFVIDMSPEAVAERQAFRKAENDQLWARIREDDARFLAAQEPTVICDCGHETPRSHVMSASRGTCCPDCYDRMSL